MEDAMCHDDYDVQQLDENRQRCLLDEDENEDFLVDGEQFILVFCGVCGLRNKKTVPMFSSVGTLASFLDCRFDFGSGLSSASVNGGGQEFPWSLRLAACLLLFEITAFLRDSYRRGRKSGV